MDHLRLLPPGSPEPEIETPEMRPQPHGGALRTGNPGNHGNPDGRPPIYRPTKDRAGRVLREALQEAEARLKAAREQGGPKMATRDLVAIARLAAEVEARDLPGDKPPVRVMVLRGSEADMRAALAEPTVEAGDAIEGGEVRELPPGDAGAER